MQIGHAYTHIHTYVYACMQTYTDTNAYTHYTFNCTQDPHLICCVPKAGGGSFEGGDHLYLYAKQFVYMHLHIYIYTYIYIHMYIYIYACINVSIHVVSHLEWGSLRGPFHGRHPAVPGASSGSRGARVSTLAGSQIIPK